MATTKVSTAVKLDQTIFNIKTINHELIRLAYEAYLANGRTNLAKTQTRGMVSGSNKKPWQQKGTGRARVGSKRTPLWRGGGIVFGPTGNENYSKKINQQAKNTALKHTLSALNQNGLIKVIDDFTLAKPKTAELVKHLNKAGCEEHAYTLLIDSSPSTDLILAARNLPDLKLISADYLNAASVLDADCLVFTKSGLTKLTSRLSPKTITEVKK